MGLAERAINALRLAEVGMEHRCGGGGMVNLAAGHTLQLDNEVTALVERVGRQDF